MGNEFGIISRCDLLLHECSSHMQVLREGRWWGQDSGDMMMAATQPDTQQESEVVGNTIGLDPTQQSQFKSAKQTTVNMTMLLLVIRSRLVNSSRITHYSNMHRSECQPL